MQSGYALNFIIPLLMVLFKWLIRITIHRLNLLFESCNCRNGKRIQAILTPYTNSTTNLTAQVHQTHPQKILQA